MNDKYLYETLEALEQAGVLQDIPEIIENGLSTKIELREYQIRAFKYFVSYFENHNLHKNKQIHTLFHMATGSGKTVIMAGLILYLYTKGYNKFLFFVNQTNVVEKTKDNFTNISSNKYLFNKELSHAGNKINIKMVDNFSVDPLNNDIQICFTTTQKLHFDLQFPRENSITYKDFEDNKIVFISDESHHINSSTKKSTKEEIEENNSWEYSVTHALSQNRDSIMLEFTATADLKDKNVINKYKDKIIFDYQLKKFRESGYTKDFQNFATESELWDRTLMALILSEYRRFLFSDNKLNVKPVVMLKSQRVAESKEFYELFFDKVEHLSSEEIKMLQSTNIQILSKALNYFKEKDLTFELLEHSIKNSFTKDNAIYMNETTDNNREKQLLVNSLEDKENPIRIIFTVDMLNEGWDVLNLYDIVRLYDTRQGSGKAGKIGNYTIKEAQLIGRGARYCPFKINDEQEMYKRKYDNDLTNDLRILETMFFHSRNDSSYIAELRQALIEAGLQDKDTIKLDYKIKEEFKDTLFYKNAYVFSNKRVPKDRKNIINIEDSVKTKVYRYTVRSNKGNVLSLMGDQTNEINQIKTNIKSLKFKDIEYNILRGSIERFNELRFNVIKSKYPNLKSMREFITSDDYLGNSSIEITYSESYTSNDIRKACVRAFESIASHVNTLRQNYEGTRQFEPIMLNNVIKDKSIYLTKIDENGGKGDSQNSCINPDYRLNLLEEDWYIFNDNYGTSEEKLFIKYFKTNIQPKLDEKQLEYYVIRNERIPELAIYSFEHGERFEPDFLLFVCKNNNDSLTTHQVYVEPKGSNLLLEDKWKEEFMQQLIEDATINPLFDYGNNYKIIGMPFYNEEYKKEEFEQSINEWLEKL